MAGQAESSTTLNVGAGGDAVRDLTLTPPSTGTPVKQQVVSVGDPTSADRLAVVSIAGEFYVRAEDLIGVQQNILRELKRMNFLLAQGFGTSLRDDEIDEGEL